MQLAILVAFAMLIFFIPIYHSYSSTDEEEGQNEEGEETTEDGSPMVRIDPSSSDSLSVLSHRISTDEILDDPTMDIDGEIQNNGTVSLDFVRATATFYDANNSILGSDFAYTEPTTLEPGQAAPFSITVGFGDNVPVGEISSIKLHVSGR
jgi:hypothetical protein